METNQAVTALSALALETRLDIFRLLVRAEPEGLPAGDIARALNVQPNTLSTHLAILSRAGLLQSERDGRSIIYRVQLDRLRTLVLFLLQDCCGGNAELCAPILAELSPCC
ncbi:MAG: winged helix-turn-helix transcriptional regulator [Rhizorhabdus sp.]|uniref:ArsR/SmtB family transcription factor n=1 Tax=Rhizorhabdus sp. TaxID=1968843 RepID=UPI001B736C79|nr:metalloregulator ArsR/SmtB family transcription factor [Rhizorhabdus sp.]MBP8232096.1 winged helix-turn-helix transcriptional regulator [Rhizorhabdus sp.]